MRAQLSSRAPPERRRILGDHVLEHVLGTAEKRRQRGTEREQRRSPGEQSRHAPRAAVLEGTLADERQHPGGADRRLADAAVAGDDDEPLDAQAIERLVDDARPAEEQAAMLRLE